MNKEERVYLSIGSNMGNKLYYILEAIKLIHGLDETRVSKVSSFYETAPWGVVDQDTFFNIAIEVKTRLLPFKLLRKLQEIELLLHRRREKKWGPRTLDIDIIFYGNLCVSTKDLDLPHKRFKERRFVLEPLYEIYFNKEKVARCLKNDTSVVTRVRPNVVVGSCLLGENCTYRGDNNKKKFLDMLKGLNFIGVCPEVDGGMTTPRVPSEILGKRVISKDGKEVTEFFERGAEIALERALKSNCKVAFLKKKSPSCGFGKVYDGTFTKNLIEGDGIAAKLLKENGIEIISL